MYRLSVKLTEIVFQNQPLESKATRENNCKIVKMVELLFEVTFSLVLAKFPNKTETKYIASRITY